MLRKQIETLTRQLQQRLQKREGCYHHKIVIARTNSKEDISRHSSQQKPRYQDPQEYHDQMHHLQEGYHRSQDLTSIDWT